MGGGEDDDDVVVLVFYGVSIMDSVWEFWVMGRFED